MLLGGRLRTLLVLVQFQGQIVLVRMLGPQLFTLRIGHNSSPREQRPLRSQIGR